MQTYKNFRISELWMLNSCIIWGGPSLQNDNSLNNHLDVSLGDETSSFAFRSLAAG